MQPPRSFLPQQDSYENTEQTPETMNIPYPNNFDLRPPTEFKKTSADNPFRCKSSQSLSQELPDAATNKGVDTFKALLVGQGEGPSGDLLKQLEDAISRGDHK